MRTIVVGFVDTPEGAAALHAAADEARSRDAQLVVTHSARGGFSPDGEEAVAVKTALHEVTEQLAEDGVPFQVRNLVRGNDPAEDIVDMVREYDAELIVVGLRSRTPVGKLLLGSEVERVLMLAPCPVLAVKADYQ